MYGLIVIFLTLHTAVMHILYVKHQSILNMRPGTLTTKVFSIRIVLYSLYCIGALSSIFHHIYDMQLPVKIIPENMATCHCPLPTKLPYRTNSVQGRPAMNQNCDELHPRRLTAMMHSDHYQSNHRSPAESCRLR